MFQEELGVGACSLAEYMSTDLDYCTAFATAAFALLMFFPVNSHHYSEQ